MTVPDWTDAEYAWANAHNGCDMGNHCWNECAEYWLEQARQVLQGRSPS